MRATFRITLIAMSGWGEWRPRPPGADASRRHHRPRKRIALRDASETAGRLVLRLRRQVASKLWCDFLACLGVEDTTRPCRSAAVEGAGQSEPQVGEAFPCRFKRAPDVSQLDHGSWSCTARARMQRLPVVTVDVTADEGRERGVGVGALKGGNKLGSRGHRVGTFQGPDRVHDGVSTVESVVRVMHGDTCVRN